MQPVAQARNTTKVVRLGVADHIALFRDSFGDCLGRHPRFEVVWTATQTREALEKLDQTMPDLVLVDVELPEGNAFDLARAVLSRLPTAKVAFLGDNPCDAFLQQVLRLNASGFLTRATPFARVATMIEHMMSGQRCYSPEVERRLVFDAETGRFRLPGNGSLTRLTRRQLQVLTHLARGDSVKEVARKLHLTQKAVDSHKYRIMRTLDIHDRVHLARYAIREGLTKP